jgi:ABC-type sugar transport system permease subunit
VRSVGSVPDAAGAISINFLDYGRRDVMVVSGEFGLKVYDLPFTLTGGGPGFATRTITQSIITSGVAQGRYGLASALAVMFTIAVGVFALTQILVSRTVERRIL